MRVQQRHLWSGWLWCFLVSSLTLSLQEILSRKTSSTCTKSPTERGSFYSTCSTISPVNTKQTLACLLVCLFFGGVWFLKHVNDWFWCNQDDFKWENVLTTVVMSHEEIVPILDERQRLAIPSKRIWTSVTTLFSQIKAPTAFKIKRCEQMIGHKNRFSVWMKSKNQEQMRWFLLCLQNKCWKMKRRKFEANEG